MEFITALEWFTVVVTLIVISSGFPACVNMYRSKSTKNVPYTLFLVYAFVSTLCLQYSFVMKNTVMILVNAIALLVWVGYISVYFLITQNKSSAFMKASAILFLYWAHLQYLAMVDAEKMLPTLGIYMVIWCTIVSVVPCAGIVTMYQTKNCSCCDRNMLYATTLSSCTWTFYGYVVNDYNIVLSSLPGIIVNTVQFVLIFMYSSSEPKKIVEKNIPEKDTSNGHFATEFHEQVYKVKPRNSLRKGIEQEYTNNNKKIL